MIEVEATPPLNTVQDLGRPGYRDLGVGASGAMDPLALKIGNLLVDNDEGCAAVELQTFPFAARFRVRTAVVVTGASPRIRLDGRTVIPWVVTVVQPGELLTVEAPATGARSYLCVAGGIGVIRVLGSRSTQLRGSFGGFEGRPLRAGDVLPIAASALAGGYGAVPPASFLDRREDDDSTVMVLRAIPATDHDAFTPAARRRFWEEPWRITPQSDRVGYRLRGEPLMLEEPMELLSYGIVPGIVQVPPSGEPIVQAADANTAGGYPRIACVIEADLWRLGQARAGTSIRFARCDHREGVEAMRPLEAYLENLRTMVSFYRRSAARRGAGVNAGLGAS